MNQREIKFRAWDKKLNRLWIWEDLKNLPMSDFKREDLEWLQYTGLKDKNGKEIYAGDILTAEDYVGFARLKAEVIFNRGRFCLNTGTIPEDLIPELCEVIGNIYETPELLNTPSVKKGEEVEG